MKLQLTNYLPGGQSCNHFHIHHVHSAFQCVLYHLLGCWRHLNTPVEDNLLLHCHLTETQNCCSSYSDRLKLWGLAKCANGNIRNNILSYSKFLFLMTGNIAELFSHNYVGYMLMCILKLVYKRKFLNSCRWCSMQLIWYNTQMQYKQFSLCF